MAEYVLPGNGRKRRKGKGSHTARRALAAEPDNKEDIVYDINPEILTFAGLDASKLPIHPQEKKGGPEGPPAKSLGVFRQ